MRGYFGIGIINTKTEMNIGTLWRSAHIFGAAFIFTIGKRYKKQASDTPNTPLHVPLYHFLDFDDFQTHRPLDCQLIGIEIDPAAIDLSKAMHHQRAIYLLGAEDNGIPKNVLDKCQGILRVESTRCLNVAVAGSIVMWDRAVKMDKGSR